MDPKEMDGVRQRLARRMMLVSRRRFLLADMLLEKTGIGAGQVPILMELQRHGEMTQSALAEHVHVTPATMSGTLKRMERDGRITRRGDERDARVSLVRLTEAGERLCERAHELFIKSDELMFEGVSNEECEWIYATLETVLENLEKAIQGESHEKASTLP